MEVMKGKNTFGGEAHTTRFCKMLAEDKRQKTHEDNLTGSVTFRVRDWFSECLVQHGGQWHAEDEAKTTDTGDGQRVSVQPRQLRQVFLLSQ